jgi:hypothetical protein
MARLPEHLYEDTIANIVNGSGYTVPWAIFTGEDGELYINGGYSITKEPGGATGTMFVTIDKDGITVDITRCGDHKWSPDAPCYVGGDNRIKVNRLIC